MPLNADMDSARRQNNPSIPVPPDDGLELWAPAGMPAASADGIVAWVAGSIGYILIHRPAKANSYTQAMLDAMDRARDELEANTHVRLLVFTGAGQRAFCAGADREEMAQSDYRHALDLKSHDVFARVAACPKVTLAAINGAAVGGGLELALACDLRLAVKEATFALPEPRLGILPAAGGLRWLVPLVGVARAKELILGGAVWSASQASRFHLVHRVVPRKRLWVEVEHWAVQVEARDPLALRLAKEMLNAGNTGPRNVEKIAQALLYHIKGQRSQHHTGSSS